VTSHVAEARSIQNAGFTDEAIAHARSLVGVWLRRDVHWPAFAEPISAHDIRRWALYSMGDDNPLWTDEDYARRTRWGALIAPPTFLYSIDSTIVAPGLRGIQWIYGGTRWEFHHPVRVGDTITAEARLINMEEKRGDRARHLVVQTGEVLYSNQRDELVARAEADVLRVPRKGSSSRGLEGFDSRREQGRYRYSDDEIEEIRQAYVSEYRRGPDPRYWEDVAVGELLPRIAKGPLTLVDIMSFYAGRRNTYRPLKLAFLEREAHPANVYVSPSTNVPVHPAAGHMDDEIAREVGMPGPYDQGWMRANWMSHLVTNWCGDRGFVERLDIRLTTPNILGDTTWCHGRVVARDIVAGRHTVTVECWGQTQTGERNVTATAVVRLPSRQVSAQEAVA
jgi:acyl dehydratase